MRLISAFFLSVLWFAPAAAQDNFLFRGVYTIEGKNQACVGRNPVGDDGLIRLRVAADKQGSSFVLYHPLSSQAFHLNGSLFNASFKTVQTMTVVSRFARESHPVSARFTSQSPITITPNITFVSFVGFIKGYGSRVGCVVRFRAALTKNID